MQIKAKAADYKMPAEPQVKLAGLLSLLSRLGNIPADLDTSVILRLYRLSSLLLSILLFLVFPNKYETTVTYSLIFLLTVSAFLIQALYESFCKKTRIIAALIMLELFLTTILMAYFGGFHGPFLWYALNPFITATVFLPFTLIWVMLAVLLAGTFTWKALLFGQLFPFSEIFARNYYQAINLVIIILIMYLFARMHMNILESTIDKKVQQHEMLLAYKDLSKHHEIFRALSHFQQKLGSLKSQIDIYKALIETIMSIFPFRQALIFIPPPDNESAFTSHGHSCQLITPGGIESSSSHRGALDEIEERWEEFYSLKDPKLISGRDKQWVALPIFGEQKKIKSVLIGWLHPQINPFSIAENLSLFVGFAAQTTDWLYLFKQKERMLQHIVSIYEAIEAAASKNCTRLVIEMLASYALVLTGCDKTIFWLENSSNDSENYDPIYVEKEVRDRLPEEEWKIDLPRVWSDILENKKPIVVKVNNDQERPAHLIGVPVTDGSHCLGILAGIQASKTYRLEEIIQTLTILADLGAITVERSKTEQLSEKLMIIDEQKRIANEIHDTISQNLFSIVYGIDALIRENTDGLGEEIKERMQDVKNLSAETSRDLRALIYRLNPRHDSNQSFIQELCAYLEQTARMNRVQMKHIVEGDACYLNPAMCKTFYRIVKEATGNALRHGCCSEVMVRLEITPFMSTLKVNDNGIGFNLKNSLDLSNTNKGLGLVNMRELTNALQGTLNIESNPGKGTKVTCSIPTSPLSAS